MPADRLDFRYQIHKSKSTVLGVHCKIASNDLNVYS